MLYHYLASDKDGKIIEAEIDADSVSQVLQYLSGKELRPVSVSPVGETKKGVRFLSAINLTDKVFITKYLSLMLQVGTDLLSAINILIADFEKPAVKNFLLEVRENLTKGQPFYEAFERYPKIFSTVFINLIKAAEASGNLQQTFEDLSTSLTREAELRSRIRGALIYPAIILTASLAIFIFLSTYAIPKIADVFSQSGISPPLFSRVVFAVGLFFNANIILIGIVFISVLSGAFFFFSRTTIGRRMGDRMFSHLPLIKGVYRDLAIQRFAYTLSSLIKAGLPIINAIKITADVVGFEEFKVSLLRIADEGLARGLTIGDAFRREMVFPRVVTNLVTISEKAGHLDSVLITLSDFYASRVDTEIKTLVAFLEPLLLLMMGGMVAVIALSIIVPIYQLTTQF